MSDYIKQNGPATFHGDATNARNEAFTTFGRLSSRKPKISKLEYCTQCSKMRRYIDDIPRNNDFMSDHVVCPTCKLFLPKDL